MAAPHAFALPCSLHAIECCAFSEPMDDDKKGGHPKTIEVARDFGCRDCANGHKSQSQWAKDIIDATHIKAQHLQENRGTRTRLHAKRDRRRFTSTPGKLLLTIS